MLFCARVFSLLAIFWPGFAWTREPAKTRDQDSFCQPFPSIALDASKLVKFANGSLMHNGLMYPVGSYRVLENETYGCVCNLRGCLRKCCRRNEILGAGDRPNCVSLPNDLPGSDLVLKRENLANEIQGISRIADLFAVVEDMECPKNTIKYMLEPEHYKDDEFVLDSNGVLRTSAESFPASAYCLDWKESFETIGALVCQPMDVPPDRNQTRQTVYQVGVMVSIPFFLATFLVYAIIPELRNLYGKTLMCYVGCLIVAYFFLTLVNLFHFTIGLCFAIGYTIAFSFFASFFWLNVMCFDIWWTFGGFRSLQGSVNQTERKKFLIYSIYAWGCASLLTGVILIMDYAPNISKNLIRPDIGKDRCWFDTTKAIAIYFYGPIGVTLFCNICLFISTAMKIVKHRRDTAHHLRGEDSRRHDDKKQWFNLYLKLFVVMGITWSMEIISFICGNKPEYIWYLSDLANCLQGVTIFLIFVWKEKIRRLLLKQFGCRNRDLWRNSTRSGYNSSTSRTYTTSAVPLQEKINPYTSEPLRTNKSATGYIA